MLFFSEFFLNVGNFWGYVWLFLTLILLFLELINPGLFFFVSFACGTVCAAIVAFFGFSLLIQLWVALISGILSFIIIKKVFVAHKTKTTDYRSNVDALIGQEGIVLSSIQLHQPGFVKVRGEIWSAVLKDGLILEKGTAVRVVDIEGNKLVVRSLS